MNRNIILIASSLYLTSCAPVEYERKLESYESTLAFGEAIIYPHFEVDNEKFSEAIASLVDGSAQYSPEKTSGEGVGLSVIPIIDPNESNPTISINVKGKNFFELLDLICIQSGPEYYWFATDAVVVERILENDSKSIDPFENNKPSRDGQRLTPRPL